MSLEITKEILHLHQDSHICDGCIHKNVPCSAMSTVVITTNNSGEIDLFIVGQGAGKDEDININKGNTNREPFIGRAGAYLRSMIMHIWMCSGKRFNIALSNNVRCHPMDAYGKDRPPTLTEIERCSQYLVRDIKKLNPRCILAVGKNAAMTFFPELEEFSMAKIRHIKRAKQFNFSDTEAMTCSIVSTYHPSYLCRQYGKYIPAQKNPFDIKFIADMNWALNGELSNIKLY